MSTTNTAPSGIRATGRRLARLVAAGILVGATLTFASPAQAQVEGLYLSKDRDHRGETRIYTTSRSSFGGGFSDEASSAENYSSLAWVLFDDENYRDRHYCLRPHEIVYNLHDPAWNFGDKVSSALRLNTSSCAGYPTFLRLTSTAAGRLTSHRLEESPASRRGTPCPHLTPRTVARAPPAPRRRPATPGREGGGSGRRAGPAEPRTRRQLRRDRRPSAAAAQRPRHVGRQSPVPPPAFRPCGRDHDTVAVDALDQRGVGGARWLAVGR
jgi:hypothetical protein